MSGAAGVTAIGTSSQRGRMTERSATGGPEPALLHLDQDPLDSPLPPVGRIDARIQRAIEAMLAFLRRTGYPAVAAPQLGLPHRIVAVDLTGSGRSAIVLVDPVIRAVSLERTVDLEGCLSLPDATARVERPERAWVEARARTGQRVVLEVGGLLGRILQHKLEHLDGRLFLELVSPRDRLRWLSAAVARRPACRLSDRHPRIPGAA